jgi:hypothetical protein
MSKHEPTSEQNEAVFEYGFGDNMKIVAFAGAGKTSTLVLMAQSSPKIRCLYMAFNKRIVDAAKGRFPSNVRISTVHARAYGTLIRHFDEKKLRFKPRIKEMLATEPAVAGLNDWDTGRMISKTLGEFFRSCDTIISLDHVPTEEQLASTVRLFGVEEGEEKIKEFMTKLRENLVNASQRIWARMCDSKDTLPLGSDAYIKLWALGEPNLGCDVLFLDEAQDLDPVMIGVIKKQTCQVVAVGDPHQQIYSWRGAVNALDEFGGTSCYLTQSFRFGERVAQEANWILRLLGETRTLIGNPAKESVAFERSPHDDDEEVDAILCRTNAGVLNALVRSRGAVFSPSSVVQDLKMWVSGAESLKKRLPVNEPEEFKGYTDWEQVVAVAGDLNSEMDAGFRRFVRIVEERGTAKLREILSRIVEEQADADISISTTHAAKGLEWPRVRVDSDFLTERFDKETQTRWIPLEQVRLLYVAMTRGKRYVSFPFGLEDFYRDPRLIKVP